MWRVGAILLIAASALVGCGEQGEQFALPTLTLVPPTETNIPTTIPATPTDDPELTSPESLLTAAAPTQSGQSTENSAIDDPIASELALIARQQVAEALNISVRRVRVVSAEAQRWADSSLGCPQEDQIYTQIEVDGYRIEVRAGDETYIFHTDFDRVIPCDNEAQAPP
jgi:hypothetical protein